MKKLISLSALSLLALSFAFTTPASAQVCDSTGRGGGMGGGKGRCGMGNTTGTGAGHRGLGSCNGTGTAAKAHPNFVDANGDGICDHFQNGTSGMKARNGSCNAVPKAGTTNAPATKSRMGNTK